MKKLIGLLASVALIVALIACGGEGNHQFSAATRSVQRIQRLSFLSMGNSGLFMPGFWYGGGAGGGTTGSGTSGGGGGGGYSMGGFVRNFFAPGGGARAVPGGAGTSGGTVGGGGGTGNEYFYYDEWLQLWVQSQWTETTYSNLFYIDQAKTQPAGHMTSTFADNWETYPQVYTSEYEFTAGTQSGAHGTYNCTQSSISEGNMSYSNVYADGSHDQGSSNWSDTGSHWEGRWDSATGTTWFEDSGSWTADGHGTYSCSNSDGWSADWTYNPDFSGSAHFEGPDALLPADLTWTADGHYHIVYADGSTEDWTWEDIWGESGVGTSGSTGGVGTTGSATSGEGGTGEGTTGVGTTGSGTSGT